MTESFLTKSLLGVCAITAFTILPVFGAGSGSINPPANQGFPQIKQENPAIKAYNEGVDLMKAKQFAKAQAKFEQAIKANPNFGASYLNLGILEVQRGHRPEAIWALQGALRFETDSERAKAIRAQLALLQHPK